MMGSRNLAGANPSLKRKRDQESEESNANEYFFAKFLTSPELLDLEVTGIKIPSVQLLTLIEDRRRTLPAAISLPTVYPPPSSPYLLQRSKGKLGNVAKPLFANGLRAGT